MIYLQILFLFIFLFTIYCYWSANIYTNQYICNLIWADISTHPIYQPSSNWNTIRESYVIETGFCTLNYFIGWNSSHLYIVHFWHFSLTLSSATAENNIDLYSLDVGLQSSTSVHSAGKSMYLLSFNIHTSFVLKTKWSLDWEQRGYYLVKVMNY